MKTHKLNTLKMRDGKSFAKIKQNAILAVGLLIMAYANFTIFFRGF